MNHTHAADLEGWQWSPNKRGTVDIVWGCASTIFVCVWVMLHLNLPAEKDTDSTIFFRKLKWFTLAMLAPELLMLFAGGQWAAAKRSVSDMSGLCKNDKDDEDGKKVWTMVHGFFAESGGFMLQTKDEIKFPVTARQIHYLVEKGYIEVPHIRPDEIEDKSKADGFAKVTAAAQSLWFVIQILGRWAEGIAVTLLELSTICLMTCTASTLFFWYHKPLDVHYPSSVECKYTMAEIILKAGDAAKEQYHNTPLDFCDTLEYASQQFPFHRLWSESQRPLPRLPNDRDTLLHNWKVLLVLSIPTAAFGTLQLIAWNFTFPTRDEQLLWRWTCVGGCAVLGIGCLWEAVAIVASNFTLSGMQTFHNYKSRWPWCLFFFIPGLLYIVARLIVITEVIVSLRALPPSSYETVQWTNLLPHV